MAISWNDTFIGLPVEDNNPGRGAEAIRDTRKGVDERMTGEHFWGDPEESTYAQVGGYHKEGSAVVKVIDEDSTQRDTDHERVSHNRVGTLSVDMQLLGSGNWRTVAGIDQATEGGEYPNRVKKVQLYFTDGDGVTQTIPLVNHDKLVNIDWDQTILGDKEFVRAVKGEADDDSIAVTALPADFNPSDAAYDTNYLIPAKLFWKWVKDGKFHNTFNKDDTDNAPLLSGTAGIHGALYVDQDISANVIEGEIVRGAVYA